MSESLRPENVKPKSTESTRSEGKRYRRTKRKPKAIESRRVGHNPERQAD